MILLYSLDAKQAMHHLHHFITQLSITGAVTAEHMYGFTGWVAHGFTDGDINTGRWLLRMHL